jgi:hypothetical protein
MLSRVMLEVERTFSRQNVFAITDGYRKNSVEQRKPKVYFVCHYLPLEPALPKAMAVALPMPLVAPVMRTTLSLSDEFIVSEE